MTWAASHFDHCCAYGEDVIEVLPEKRGDEVALLRIRSRNREQVVHERLTRNLVISIGGQPRIPESFALLKGDPRVFHSNNYLKEIKHHPHAKKIAVVGGGQSAAEIFMDLHHRYEKEKAQVDLIMRARAIKPSDDSPFVNEIFNTDFTDYVFNSSDQQRTKSSMNSGIPIMRARSGFDRTNFQCVLSAKSRWYRAASFFAAS